MTITITITDPDFKCFKLDWTSFLYKQQCDVALLLARCWSFWTWTSSSHLAPRMWPWSELRFCRPARGPRSGKPPKVLARLLSGVLLSLVAPYCAIPREYLSDTPLSRDMGFRCLNMANWVRYPPPLKRNTSAILARYPMKTRQMGAIPLSDTISKGYCAIWGCYLALGHDREDPSRAPECRGKPRLVWL